MLKRTSILTICLLLVFGLAGPATAANPEPTTCWFSWQDTLGKDIFFEIPGEVVYNERSQVYNISCNTTLDFNSGEYASVADTCAVVPNACNNGQQIFMLNDFWWFWFNGMDYYEIADSTLQVNANGQVSLRMQLAPGQCGSEFRSINYTYQIPDGYWTPGIHIYEFEAYGVPYPVVFTVDENAPLYASNVRLGLTLYSEAGFIDTINPAQDTYIQLTYYAAAADIEYLKYDRENMPVTLSIDGGDPIVLEPSPITNMCTRNNPALLVRDWGYAR